MFELIINILLFIFLGFTYFTHVLEAAVPAKVAKNPFVLQPDVWPKTIIVLLEICLIINIIQIIRKNKGKEDFTIGAFLASIPSFLKSKQFLGIVIMVAASLLLEPLGFMVTSVLVLFFYGLLLGQRNVVQLVIASVCITLVLYIVFNGMLSVNLPRGTIGFLRNFALWMESIIGAVKSIF
ncbi:MAG: tripartite tricarboxylate transporter TctB family protein [Candidatus Ventricola sp.]